MLYYSTKQDWGKIPKFEKKRVDNDILYMYDSDIV